MLHFLVFLFIIVIAIVLIGLSIIGSVIRSILGLGGRRSSSSYGTYQNKGKNNHADNHSGYGNKQANNARQEEAQSEEEDSRPRHKKLFSKDEGEYVDFEEMEE